MTGCGSLEKRAGHWYIVHRVATEALDGTEQWWNYGSDAPYIKVHPMTNKQVGPFRSLCSHFSNMIECWGPKTVGTYSDHASVTNTYFVTDFDSDASWKSWLAAQAAAGTPVTLYYTLAQETEELMPDTVAAGLDALSPGAGETILHGTDTVPPSIRVDYHRDLNAVIARLETLLTN